jgi:hypothetical protein
MRKIEIFYALHQAKNDFPKTYYHGIHRNLNLYSSYKTLKECNQLCPGTIHKDFLKLERVQIQYAEKKVSNLVFFCKNKDFSCYLTKKEVEAIISTELLEAGASYRCAYLGADTCHPYVGSFLKIHSPDYVKFSNFTQNLKEHLRNFRSLSLPKMPRFDFLVEAAQFERENGTSFSLADCLFDSWFFQVTEDNKVKTCFFYSLDDFIALQNGKSNVLRNEFSATVNTVQKRYWLLQFIKEQDFQDCSFCVPEQSQIFQNFSKKHQLNVRMNYCSVS